MSIVEEETDEAGNLKRYIMIDNIKELREWISQFSDETELSGRYTTNAEKEEGEYGVWVCSNDIDHLPRGVYYNIICPVRVYRSIGEGSYKYVKRCR